MSYSRLGNASSDTDSDGGSDGGGVESIAMLVTAAETENKVLSEKIADLEAENKALAATCIDRRARVKDFMDEILAAAEVQSLATLEAAHRPLVEANKALSEKVAYLEVKISTMRLARLGR